MIIKPVILSGGSGTRLWPLSRQLHPKQLLPLVGEHTLLQDTILRLSDIPSVTESSLIVCNEEHRFLIAEQLREIDAKADALILEPEGRNTAPALTLAALSLNKIDTNVIMLVLPADHVIQDQAAFQKAVQSASQLAEQGYVVTFGIVPDHAETGYGYIEQGEKLQSFSAGYELLRFVEKPNSATAQEYIASGRFLWNSGMFMIRVDIWLQHIEYFNPNTFHHCEKAFANGKADYDFYRVESEQFKKCNSDSIDVAVMEKLTSEGMRQVHKAAVVPLAAGWSDVGAWGALWEIGKKDSQGNVIKGDVVNISCRNSMLLSNHRLVTGVGIDDLVIVETADAVLIAHRDSVQDVKIIVESLKQQQRTEHISHRCVYRPWGSYEGIDSGERYQVKRITVKPGAALSLQMHHHRAEHWVVVKGMAKVTRDNEVYLVAENQSTFIPIGIKHRLENPGTIPLEMIEVQSGAYLGEDDIVRFDDKYGRNP